MKPTEFCYWLQGYFELSNDQKELTPAQVKIVKNHLNLVFLHSIDPKQGLTPEQEAEAQAVHDGEPIKIGGVDVHGNVMRC